MARGVTLSPLGGTAIVEEGVLGEVARMVVDCSLVHRIPSFL